MTNHLRKMADGVPVAPGRGSGGVSSLARLGSKGKPLLVSSLLMLAVLSTALPAAAQDTQDNQETQDNVSDLESKEAVEGTNADLLLFWEEKELYVETATRTAKPISQVAENMEVVTAKDIEEMNAHNLAEVLNRVPGVYVDNTTSDFNSTSLLHIQGSNERHVTVLLDGVVWNNLSQGSAEISSIPVQIIDRIEIIKGPASSVWGSALGGVINIITKNVGEKSSPKGTVSASYGESHSQDYNAEVYGKGGPVGYYLYAGRQDSDGLRNGRDYQRSSFYGKVKVSPAHDLDMLFTVGYSDPNINNGGVSSQGITSRTKLSTFLATGAFDYRLSPEFSLKGGIHTFHQKVDNPSLLLDSYQLNKEFIYNDRTVGGNLKLVYTGDTQSAVLGADVSSGALEQTVNAGTRYQAAGAPASAFSNPEMRKWALFANDTITINKLAVTPGIRYDYNNISGSFLSPSLGATYELGAHVIGRASVARGFTAPPLSFTSGGGLFVVPNPDLTAEYGWSYQAGLESAVFDYLNLKANVFRHDTHKEMVVDASDRLHKIVRNDGSVTRQGYELEAESAPVYNISLKAAHSFVHIAPESQDEPTVNYSYQVGIKYDDRRSWLAQLAGTYIWWNLPSDAGAKYDNFIWDLNLTKRFNISKETEVDVFINVHNLFNSPYYTLGVYPNPVRWVEGGVRVKF